MAPLFSDEEIEELVLASLDRGDDYGRVLALLATYGLRPWEGWLAEPSQRHGDCVWIPIGKKSTKGTNPPREVPPFHPRWYELFDIETLWSKPLPVLARREWSAGRVTRYLKRRFKIEYGTGRSAYGFRNAYARRIHSPEYRVTDGDGALFMGHTVMVHNQVYRRWVAGSDDPIARYR